MDLTYDVVVVGAGVAGLSAARRLARAGQRVAVLEARDRIGGRIHTLQVEGAPIELGAEFVHGRPPLLWSLIRESGLGSYELDGIDFAYEDGRLRERGGPPGPARAVLGEMTAWLARQAAGTDLSFEDYLRSNPPDPTAADAAAAYVEGFNAADRHRIGVASLVRQQAAEDAIEGDRAFRLTGGYQALPEFLASELKNAGGRLYLNSPVQRIEWRRGSVRTAAAADLRSRVALITVPLGVLQAGGIHFEPSPVGILEHAQRMAMGTAVRATLRFERKVWPDTLSFLFAPSEIPATFWTPMPERAPLITGWAGGPKAAALGGMGENGIVSCCLSTLAAIVDRPRAGLERLLRSWHVHDWSADPFARGAYSYVPAGALDASEGMTRPVEHTLYFAGEHTDVSGHWGTVHAALQSGTLAAERILDSL